MVTVKNCPICFKDFETNNAQKKYCSHECHVKRANNNIAEKFRLKNNSFHWRISRKCLICPKNYLPNSSGQKYCSKECLKTSTSQEYLILNKPYNKNISWLKLRILVLDRDGFKCMYCGRNPGEDNTKLHIDHKIPKNKGGKDILDNLITSCSECNLGKLDAILDIWKK